ncbi:MAG: hypothetical protein IPP78_03025 [Holophagaceae bacterium]|nr:hypothetical protein [Holophagaceae bacterium]
MPASSNGIQIEARFDEARIRILFTTMEAMQTFFKEAVAHGAFLLQLNEEPEPFATFAFAARAASGVELNFHAMPVQTFHRGKGCEAAFQFTDWSEDLTRQLESMMGPSPKDGILDKAPSSPADAGENLGTSPIFRIREMEVAQRIQLALKADRGDRVILCRDTMAPVLLNLLSNPQLDAENVLAIAKSPYASPDILQRVASDRRWLANADIRIALVRNPKTPTPIAQRLLETLPLNELRTLAKVGNSKEDLRRMALALVMKSHSPR